MAAAERVRAGEPVTEGLPDDAAALYELDPREFIAARNALVKRLRADRRQEQATAVAALKRPTPVAWALNQLARQAPAVIEAALEAVEALQAATDAALAGRAGDLRSATAAERAAANAVIDAAREHLGGRTEGLRQAIVGTLRAAAGDPNVTAALRAGTLSSEHDPAAFGFGSGLGDAEAPRHRRPPRRPTPSSRRHSRRHRRTRPLQRAGRPRPTTPPPRPEPRPPQHARQPEPTTPPPRPEPGPPRGPNGWLALRSGSSRLPSAPSARTRSPTTAPRSPRPPPATPGPRPTRPRNG